MGDRGRKSGASFSVIYVERRFRPNAPAELSEEQREDWRTIVRAMPPGWFAPESHGLLIALCRHISNSRRIATLVAAELANDPQINVANYDRLLRMQARQSSAIASLSTKLKLAQSTRIRADAAGRELARGVRPAPWEI